MRSAFVALVIVFGAITSVKADYRPEDTQALAVPFDTAIESLGPRFRGHNIHDIYEAIERSPALAKKSEFEATSAYEARRASFTSTPLYGNLRPTDIIAVTFDDIALAAFRNVFTYDADSQAWRIKISGNRKQFMLSDDRASLDCITTLDYYSKTDVYTGSNAYGATVEVRRTYSQDYGVAFASNSWLFRSSRDNYSRELNISLPMPAEAAMTFKTDAGLLLVCRMVQPWIRHDVSGSKPTISRPTEYLWSHSYLQITPLELWIYNRRTGEVLRKISDTSLPSSQEAPRRRGILGVFGL